MESNPQALPARLAPKHESNQLIKATRASETGWKFRLIDGVSEAGLRLPEPTWRGQGWRDGAQDVRSFRAAVLEGQVAAPVSLAMRAAFAEARTVSDSASNEKIAKGSEGQRRKRGRDDLAAAIVLAVAEGTRRETQERGKAPRGLRYAVVK